MLNRRCKDSGIEPILAYLIVSTAFVCISIYIFKQTIYAPYIYSAFAISLIAKLSESKRVEFLDICFGDKKMQKLRLFENLICAIPFVLFLFFTKHFLIGVILIVTSVALAFTNFRTKFQVTIWTPFYKNPFEFVVGFRNTYYLHISFYILTVIAIYVDNFNLGLVSLLLVFATTLSYYLQPENEYYVWTYQPSSIQFLWHKIKIGIVQALILAVPILIGLACFYPNRITYILLVVLTGSAFVSAIITFKYSAYPNAMNIVQALILALCLWFPPVLILLIPYMFNKAVYRLRYLLQ
jgi:hypothetical protein